MGRPVLHGEATAEALLEAAEALLVAHGPDGVTLRAAARDAGTSTRAVYALFDGRRGLLGALAAKGYRLLATAVDAVDASGDPAEDLVRAGLAFRAFAIGHPSLFRLTFERMQIDVTADVVVGSAAIASYEALGRWIDRAQAAGCIDDRPMAEVIFAIHSLCQGLAGGELSMSPPPVGVSFWPQLRGEEAEALWRAALGALIRGMAPAA
jgi:AcrR family transcriptional regulator